MKNSADCLVQQFKSQLNSLSAAFSLINDALNFSIHDIYYNLSKFDIVLLLTLLYLIFLATVQKNNAVFRNFSHLMIHLVSIALVFLVTAPKNNLDSTPGIFPQYTFHILSLPSIPGSVTENVHVKHPRRGIC
jgi:hypothetical protein